MLVSRSFLPDKEKVSQEARFKLDPEQNLQIKRRESQSYLLPLLSRTCIIKFLSKTSLACQ